MWVHLERLPFHWDVPVIDSSFHEYFSLDVYAFCSSKIFAMMISLGNFFDS